MRKSLLVVAVLGAWSLPSVVVAEEAAETPSWTFPTSVALVSDYIFRGQTQTWGKPAAQVTVEANHKSGFYAGFFGSNVSDQWLPGAQLETDLYAGFRNKIGESDFGYDVGGIAYIYPGADWSKSGFNPPTCPACNTVPNKLNTFELYGALSYKWLSFKTGVALTEYWGWTFNNSGKFNGGFNGNPAAGVLPNGDTKGSYFYELNAAYEVFPTWTPSGQIGRQVVEDADALDITYYKLGLTKAFDGGWAVGAFYSFTNEPAAYERFLSLRDTVGQKDIATDKFFVSISRSF